MAISQDLESCIDTLKKLKIMLIVKQYQQEEIVSNLNFGLALGELYMQICDFFSLRKNIPF